MSDSEKPAQRIKLVSDGTIGGTKVEGLNGAYKLAFEAEVGRAPKLTVWVQCPKAQIEANFADVVVIEKCPYCGMTKERSK